jgi:toxin FitB
VRYLLDTCVISELVRPKPERSVVDWIHGQQEEHLHLSVMTLGEIRKGIERMEDNRKRIRLGTWLDRDLKLRFTGRWLSVDNETAERWGLITADLLKRGIQVPVIDGLIAATALVHGMTLVTRNTCDVKETGALLLNPWKQAKK